MGLAIGIHILNLLAIPCIIFILFYNKTSSTLLREIDFKKLFKDILYLGFLSFMIFGVIYLIIIKGIPNLGDSLQSLWVPIIIYISVFIFAFYFIKINNNKLGTIFACIIMILIGYSTYSTIFIRASQHPSITVSYTHLTLPTIYSV